MDHHERRQGNEQMASDIGYIKGMLESLAGPEGRITKLEAAQTRQWWLHGLQAVLLSCFGLAKKAGIL